MSVEQQRATAKVLTMLVSGCVIALSGQALADETLPDMELLEYLGSWEESDEDWVLLSEDGEQPDQVEQTDKRSDPAAHGEESQEKKHES